MPEELGGPPSTEKSVTSTSSASPKESRNLNSITVGNNLLKVLSKHPLIIILGVFVSAVVSTSTFYEWMKPWREGHELKVCETKLTEAQRFSTPSLSPLAVNLKPLVRPVKISVLGPLSGRDAGFGLSQLRGVVSGLMHITSEYLHRSSDDWKDYFSIDAIDTNSESTDKAEKVQHLVAAFHKAQQNSDVVFGPSTSQEAVDVLMTFKEEVKVPTIITTAATPKIREHSQYGKLLLQLSPNIDTYAKQYMNYLGEFLQPKPKKIVVVVKEDEYGRTSEIAFRKYAGQYNVSVEAVRYPPFSLNEGTPSKYSLKILQMNKGVLDQMVATPDDFMVIVADTGEMLGQMVLAIKQQFPSVRLGTLSSPDEEQISTGLYEGMYLIYSFAPVQFSLDTLSFYQNAQNVVPFESDILPENIHVTAWPKLETVDAEVHDATVYWSKTFLYRQVKDLQFDFTKNLYVTNFAIRGDGPALGNEGALFLFKVLHKKIVPVELTLN
jgi:ABC-type branched-subunit amino acid transport system substrate-binding protein